MIDLQPGFSLQAQSTEGADYGEILVTGGSGLVGSHLIQLLINQKKTVAALYRNTRPTFFGSEKVRWIEGDILDVVALENAFVGIKQVYHCAAIVSFSSSRKDEMYATNIEGTANVVNEALRAHVGKLCYVSSVAAIGKQPNGTCVTEETPWKTSGNGHYALSKHFAEAEVWRAIGEGLPAVIVNPTIILGSGDWTKSSSKLFKTAYDEFPFYTNGVTGFVDVHDVVQAMVLLMEGQIEAERFILNAANISFKDLLIMMADSFRKKRPRFAVGKALSAAVVALEAIKAYFSGEEPLITAESRQGAISKIYYDSTKVLQALPGFTFTPIKDTIATVSNSLLNEVNSLPV